MGRAPNGMRFAGQGGRQAIELLESRVGGRVPGDEPMNSRIQMKQNTLRNSIQIKKTGKMRVKKAVWRLLWRMVPIKVLRVFEKRKEMDIFTVISETRNFLWLKLTRREQERRDLDIRGYTKWTKDTCSCKKEEEKRNRHPICSLCPMSFGFLIGSK